MARPSRASLIDRYDFVLDRFQIEALDALDRGDSVLVAAPTGSGKTLVAEYAIDSACQQGRRAFYTAPIKALSNQKYNDLVAHYGATGVGLMTGDTSVNVDAPILVMTTEVLRNMIYARSNALDNLAVVVLDEVHFLQDAYRGPVWEEVIIHLEPTVQLVCLSATVSNADEVSQWLTTVRGMTVAVVEHKRPVELFNHYVVGDKTHHRVNIFETIVGGVANSEVVEFLHRATGPTKRSRVFTPNRVELVNLLEEQDLLPAIVFIFSRNQCEEAAQSCLRAGINLTTKEESRQIAQIIDSRLEAFSDDDLAALEFSRFANQLESGIGAHHAGLVPAFKEIVEECFIRGLVRLVFATETLAVGLNMPARAVVIEKLTKFTGENHKPLTALEYTQLTGRAGRRGIDTVGHALVLWNQFGTFDQAASLALSRSFRLVSAFRPTYNMAANLIQSHSVDQSHHLLNLSFAQFQKGRGVVEMQSRIGRLTRERDKLRQQSHSDFGDIEEYARAGAVRVSARDVEEAIGSLKFGDIILLPKIGKQFVAVVVATTQRASGRKITVITTAHDVVDLKVGDFSAIPIKLGHLVLPVGMAFSSQKFVKQVTKRLQLSRIVPPNSRSHSRPVVDHPVLQDPDLRRKLTALKSAQQVEAELTQVNRLVGKSVDSVSQRFDELVALMERRGYVNGWRLTAQGETLAKIFHELDLLIAESLSEGVFDDLDPPNLAALMSVFVYEFRRSDEPPKPQIAKGLQKRWKLINQISLAIAQDEAIAGIAPHRLPDPGLIQVTFDWARGADLGEILSEDLLPGDFVRTMKQLIDLLRQVSLVAPNESTRKTARLASQALLRGVVVAAHGTISSD